MQKRLNWRFVAITSACGAALLLGVGLGLYLTRGSHEATQTGEDSTQPDKTTACSSEISALVERAVPEPGPSLGTTLKQAISRYVTCQSLSAEQFAQAFATLSVVVAQYAAGSACLQDDADSRSTRWSDHKTWADRQDRAEVLLANLGSKIDRLLGCLQPDQQRLFYTDFARAFTFAAARHAKQAFANPEFQGQRIDRCLYQGRECDEPAARAWCGQYGYGRMATWEWARAPQTLTLGDRHICKGSSCGAFTSIVCAQ